MQTCTAPILPGVPQALAHDLQAMAGATAYNAWLIDRARPWLHGRVLDVGAGIGTHTRQLLPLADEVVALEPDAQFAQMLRERVDGVRIVEGDAADVEGAFDAIVCFNVLEHIEDDVGTLRRLGDLLAPDGALLLLVPAHQVLFGPIDTAFGHYRRYGKGELDEKLRAAGLAPDVLRHVNPVGALGWLTQARIRKRERMSYRGLDFYDRLVPALRLLDSLPLPVGLSLWAVAKTSGTASASARNA
jgi:SAM-dependent methyltransferase